jgi:hypothetical protein
MKRRTVIVCGGLLLSALLTGSWALHDRFHSSFDRLLILVPDETSLSDPKVNLWVDAGNEEGLHVVPVHDSDFISPLWGQSQCAGVILPDSIHQRASDPFLADLHNYVAGGGKLMLAYDAGTLLLNGGYASGNSRLSDLAGVNYAFYDSLRDHTIQWSSVSTSESVARESGIPPGKYYPFHSMETSDSAAGKFEVELRRYKYGDLQYPSFVTQGEYAGTILFHSQAGVVAGEHSFGRGFVLFVNLPLGYLKSNTDGLPLHLFLKYFANHSLSLPYLMPVPDGVGGLVLNWHIDSNAAIEPLQELNSWSLLQQGPYSIHITAGPDAMAFGDKKGFDVEHNPVSQELIRKYAARGDAIGSHGGWIHNYFADHVDKDNPSDLEQFLVFNKRALEQVTGRPVLEYSAPNGNQPPWVTHWLDAHGFIAYYFTGDTGMGPTQGYRDGTREGRNIWAFPILHLDRAAGFEEMADEGYSEQEVEAWLHAITEFTVQHRSARLLYFHPPGILEYHKVVSNWLRQTGQLRSEGKFRWYTMTELSDFLNSRKRVSWKISQRRDLATIEASHPQTLQHLAWSLPSDRFAEPRVVEGSAQVLRYGDGWIVVAGDVRNLKFESKMLNQ